MQLFDRTLGSLAMRLGVLCDHALIGQDGKLSVIGIFDHIAVVRLPAQHPRFFLVCVLQGATSASAVEMELIAPDSRVLMHESIPVDPEQISQGNGNLIAEITMLPLDQVGRYEFRMLSAGRDIGRIALNVSVVDEQPALYRPDLPRA
jgi:hypothetical protein